MPDTLTMPRRVADLVRTIEKDETLNRGITTAFQRVDDLGKTKARLIGIANDPMARSHFESEMDEMWSKTKTRDADEVVIGGGIHAAIYCAVRAAKGIKPLVIEAKKVGGAFAVSSGPSFFLNSGNRPGQLSIPGQPGALNVLPGAPIQPADLTGDEYQRNTDLSFCVRVSLAMTADVLYERVASFGANDTGGLRKYVVNLAGGEKVTTDRIIIATGLAVPMETIERPADSPYVLSFNEFMAKMGDEPFPLRGLKRVAVIGGGDSGKVAVEALTGRGPGGTWSAANLDRVERIDWFGIESTTREEWCASNRSRYAGLAREFPRAGATRYEGTSRLRPVNERVERIASGYECVTIKGVPYDLVIDATGFKTFMNERGEISYDAVPVTEPGPWVITDRGVQVDGQSVARQFEAPGEGEQDVFIIGPAAALPLDRDEGVANVPENTAAIWRWAPKTASLAASLPTIAQTLEAPPAPPADPSREPIGVDGMGSNLYVGDVVRLYTGRKIAADNPAAEYRGKLIGRFEGNPNYLIADFGVSNGFGQGLWGEESREFVRVERGSRS